MKTFIENDAVFASELTCTFCCKGSDSLPSASRQTPSREENARICWSWRFSQSFRGNFFFTRWIFLDFHKIVFVFQDPKDTPPPTRVETKEERLERRRREKAEQVTYKLEREIATWDPSNIENLTEDPFKTLYIARVVSVRHQFTIVYLANHWISTELRHIRIQIAPRVRNVRTDQGHQNGLRRRFGKAKRLRVYWVRTREGHAR